MPSAKLERHSATPCAALRAIEASVTRNQGSLQLSYCLQGDVDRLAIPAPRAPRVADRLWQHTCCELFIADAAGSGYREFNLSPSGEWAAYRFTGYRAGMAPLDIPPPHIQVSRSASRLELQARIPLESGGRIGFAAVVEQADGTLSYWALRHPPGKPDFHHRDAFALELDEVRH